MRVFADTSGLFAALVRNDAHHEPARDRLERLLDADDVKIVTTSYVLLEVSALLQNRVGLDAAIRFDRDLRPVLQVVWVDEALHRRAMRRLELRRRRQVSLVDCASFVCMEDGGIQRAFAFDRHFIDEGFEVE